MNSLVVIQLPGFETPWWLLALLVVPALWWFIKHQYAHPNPTIRIHDLTVLSKTLSTVKSKWPPINTYIIYLILVMIIVAMARPQWTMINPEKHAEGIDIVIAMDVSISMLARDFEPNRLDAAKNVAARFINERGSDRIGLVIFSGQSFTLCPLTADKAALITLLQQAQAGFIEDGSTAIGDGMATAINRLKDSDAKSKVIILLTDGENNAGNIDPLQAAEIAEMFGIRIYTIGVGSHGIAIGPVQIIGGNLIFGPTEVEIDEPTLTMAAELAKGKYFRATDEEMLYQIYQEIDQLEKSRLEQTTHHARKELFPWLLIPAIILLPLTWLIKYLFIKMLP
jgi:Ca-activated chloride channel homolog